jgi:hypothetical protein
MERTFEFMERNGSLTPLPADHLLASRRGAERLPAKRTHISDIADLRTSLEGTVDSEF